jgi:hypothetical protein
MWRLIPSSELWLTRLSRVGVVQEFKDELKKGQDEMVAEQEKAKAAEKAAAAAAPPTPVTPEIVTDEEKK